MNTLPRIHNAMWPGLVGKGAGAEPAIDLDTMLSLTAAAEVDGMRFDGVDLFLSEPHIPIGATRDELARLADTIRAKGFVVGSLVAPVWPATGGGSAMGSHEERSRFLEQVKKSCQIGAVLRDLRVRSYGVIRIDSAASPVEWLAHPAENTKRIAHTFREACDIAKSYGERLAAEGEICWGGMHSWRHMIEVLEAVDRPGTIGFQADMAHTLLYALGYNAPEDRLLPDNFTWDEQSELHAALQNVANALRPWTIDFHVAQNDGTVKGSGTHDKTGHHCLPDDPAGKLDIVEAAGLWLRNSNGEPARAVHHICWDGCMFPNEIMLRPETWNQILRTMIAVRNAHGWNQ